MIQYHRSAFGLNLLLRVHGSAVFRGAVMGVLAVVFVVLMREFWSPAADDDDEKTTNDEINHPYAVGVLISTLTFLLVFRTQAAYSRYWEACGGVYHMVSFLPWPPTKHEGSSRGFCIFFISHIIIVMTTFLDEQMDGCCDTHLHLPLTM